MPVYLSQIAAAATAAGASRRTLLPVIRSRSPIAERDQRLRLPDADWSFDESLPASDAAFGEMTSPGIVVSPGRETPAPRGQSPLLPHQAPENRVPASPSPVEISVNAPEPAGSEVPASAREPLSSGHAIIDPRRPEAARHEPGRHAAGLCTDAGSKSPGFTVAEANVDRRATGPSTPSRVSTPRLEVVAAGETDSPEPAVFQNKPRCVDEPATAIDVRSSARHSVPARSSELTWKSARRPRRNGTCQNLVGAGAVRCGHRPNRSRGRSTSHGKGRRQNCAAPACAVRPDFADWSLGRSGQTSRFSQFATADSRWHSEISPT